MNKRRPESMAPPEIFYNAESAAKYANNSRMLKVQRQMADRAIALLNLPPKQPKYILDLGCGSGLSGEAISDAGHEWVGCDISADMLCSVPLSPPNPPLSLPIHLPSPLSTHSRSRRKKGRRRPLPIRFRVGSLFPRRNIRCRDINFRFTMGNQLRYEISKPKKKTSKFI